MSINKKIDNLDYIFWQYLDKYPYQIIYYHWLIHLSLKVSYVFLIIQFLKAIFMAFY